MPTPFPFSTSLIRLQNDFIHHILIQISLNIQLCHKFSLETTNKTSCWHKSRQQLVQMQQLLFLVIISTNIISPARASSRRSYKSVINAPQNINIHGIASIHTLFFHFSFFFFIFCFCAHKYYTFLNSVTWVHLNCTWKKSTILY